MCENLSLYLICKKCQVTFLQPSLVKRVVYGLEVFSFYKYHDIEELIKTKHTIIGSEIFKYLQIYHLKNLHMNLHTMIIYTQ